jgi:flagellin
MRALRDLTDSTRSIESSSSKLSSGSRIVSAKDDAAGLAISNNLKAQQMSMKQAFRNANDSVSVLQIAEGGMNEQSSILTRMRELAMSSASDTIGDTERDLVEMEYRELAEEVQRIAESTRFNDQQLLTMSEDNFHVKDFQIGIHSDESSRISIAPLEFNTDEDQLGINLTTTWSKEDSRNSLAEIDKAILEVSSQRSLIGAYQNSLHSTINNLDQQVLNTASAYSRIKDLDYAAETAENLKAKMKMESSSKVLLQSNNFGANALKLLKASI